MHNEDPQDQLISYGEMHGWRLEVWKPGFWLDSYDYRIRPVSNGGAPVGADAHFGGCGFQTIEDAKTAALKDFQQRLRLGRLSLPSDRK